MGIRIFNTQRPKGHMHFLALLKNNKPRALLFFTGTAGLVMATASALSVNPSPYSSPSTSVKKTEATTLSPADPQPLSNIEVHSSSPDPQSNASSGSSLNSDTTITVNGQSIDVPQNGSTHQTITNSNGGSVDISVQNETNNDSSTTNTNSHSTTSTQINTFSSNSSVNLHYSNRQESP
jgi:hypothetical protein